MTNKTSQLKQVLLDRIRSGQYPVGKQLPGLRSLASEFDVHANTVAKVYNELTALGILRTLQGRGTYVMEFPKFDHSDDAAATLFEALKGHAIQARRLGLTLRDWTDLVQQAGNQAFGKDDTPIWFVECSPQDTEELAQSLSTLLDHHVSPLLVQNLPQHLATYKSNQDLIVTTPFHIEEIDACVGYDMRVVSVNVVATSETLVQFARLPGNSNVSIVCSNQQTLKRFIQMTVQYTRREPVSACLISDPQAADIVQNAEVLIDSQSIHSRVVAMKPKGHVITVRYQIEPTSLAFLREILRRRKLEEV